MNKITKILILFIFLIFICICGTKADDYIYDDPLNLINDAKISQHYYTYKGTKIYYSETYENQDKEAPSSIILVLHGGIQRSNEHIMKHITNPALQSLISYVRTNKVKVLIIAPQYPLAVDKKHYRYPQKYNNVIMQLYKDKIKQYNIPKDRFFVIGTCVGGIALNNLLNTYSDFFSKAAFVASKTIDYSKFDKKKFKTKLYFVQGDRDSLKTRIAAINALKKMSVKTNLEVLKDTNHARTLEMDVGYPDKMWKWLFKYEYTSYLEILKIYCLKLINKIRH
ncbi:hypothetical protein J6I39_09470 [bacterium]|nr:hypothetical protein [bacterium]